MRSGDFRRREFIGLEVEILDSTCPEYIGIKGRVVDETRNTLKIEQQGREKIVPKDCCEFRFDEGGKAHVVSGKDIKFRPEDRIKKVR
jgi:ribonuclease P protein subunit POP4